MSGNLKFIRLYTVRVKSILFGLSYVLIAILVISCGKDEVSFIPHSTSDPSAVLQSFAKETKNFILDTDTDTIYFKSSEGIILTIPKNSIVYNDGSPVSGKIRMQFKSIGSRSELLFENLNTISNNHLLNIYQTVYINFSKDDQKLIINPKNRNIRMFLPSTEYNESCRVYFNQRNEHKENEWREPDMDAGILEYVQFQTDTNLTLTGYSLPIQNMGWTAIGRPWIDKPLNEFLQVCAETDDLFNGSNTSLFLISEDSESTVIKCSYSSVENKFCINSLFIPDNKYFRVIAFSVIDGNKYYFGTDIIETGKSSQNYLNLKVTDLSEVITFLRRI